MKSPTTYESYILYASSSIMIPESWGKGCDIKAHLEVSVLSSLFSLYLDEMWDLCANFQLLHKEASLM